jgi:hypothetical protein
MVLSGLKELVGMTYTVGKVLKSSFQPNWNQLKILSVAFVMIKKGRKRSSYPNLVFFSQSLCNGLGSTNKPLLNMNKIYYGLLLII